MPDTSATKTFLSMQQRLHRTFQEHSAKVAFLTNGRPLLYRDLDRLAESFSASLESHGMKSGDCLGVLLNNSLPLPVVFLGALRAGIETLFLNSEAGQKEWQNQLNSKNVRVLVTSERQLQIIAPSLTATQVKHIIYTSPGDLLFFPRNFLTTRIRQFLQVRQAKGTWIKPKKFTIPSTSFVDSLNQGRHAPIPNTFSSEMDTVVTLSHTENLITLNSIDLIQYGTFSKNAPKLKSGRENVIFSVDFSSTPKSFHAFFQFLTSGSTLFLPQEFSNADDLAQLFSSRPVTFLFATGEELTRLLAQKEPPHFSQLKWTGVPKKDLTAALTDSWTRLTSSHIETLD